MHLAGSASWRFEHEEGVDTLHAALAARDAAALDVPAAPNIPPRLTEPAGPRRDAITGTDRAAAARDWAAWWDRLVAYHIARASSRFRPGQRPASQPPARASSPDRHFAEFSAWAHTDLQRRQQVFDPPDFASLALAPALRTLARTAWRDKVSAPRGPAPADPYARFFQAEWVRHVVHAVAEQHAVPVSRLDAGVITLRVDGLWSWLAAPGLALCSTVVATDETAALALLHDLFVSCVT